MIARAVALALAGVALSGTVSFGHGQPPPATRPNILWILIEDASPDIGAYGDSYARTPRLDRPSVIGRPATLGASFI